MLRYYIILIFLFFSFQNFSQNSSDFSNINFSTLNDSQIDLLLRRASSQGFNQFDLLKIAKTQGMTQSDLEKLDKRFKSAETI